MLKGGEKKRAWTFVTHTFAEHGQRGLVSLHPWYPYLWHFQRHLHPCDSASSISSALGLQFKI